MSRYYMKHGRKIYLDVVPLVQLNPAENGSTREICIVKWPNCPRRLDIRKWGEEDGDGDRQALKGITIHDDELQRVITTLQQYAGEEGLQEEDIEADPWEAPEWYEDGCPCDDCPDTEVGIDVCPYASCRYGFTFT